MGTITFTILADLKLVHFRGEGSLAPGDIVAAIKRLHGHPNWRFEYNSFIDFEHADVVIEQQGLYAYQDFFNALQKDTPPRKWAIYTREQSTHKAANMTHLLNSRSIEVGVFQRRDQALRFLGVDPELFAKRVRDTA